MWADLRAWQYRTREQWRMMRQCNAAELRLREMNGDAIAVVEACTPVCFANISIRLLQLAGMGCGTSATSRVGLGAGPGQIVNN